MRVLLSWLCDHLDGAPEADTLAVCLTGLGFLVEVREPVGDDETWDVEINTNRPDAMNHRGLAREAAAAGVGTLRGLAATLEESDPPAARSARVRVEDTAGCPRYCARVIRGVRVAPSPAWLSERLERCGIRPINNVVDATNYVLLDLGQPLHAFDLAGLAGSEIVVRRARPGEPLTTLDGVARTLTGDDLVIADRDRAVALAGVMGGADSEIGPATVDVLLESAYFDSLAVRRTARRHALSTEASFRFERGGDRTMARTAADAAAALIVRLAGGEIAAGVLDSAPRLPRPRAITFSVRRLSAFTGCEVPAEFALRVLTALGLEPAARGDRVSCTVPTWRVDLELAEDLYEEVLRHFGYNNVPSELPALGGEAGARLGSWPLTERARDALAAVGAAEAFTYAFVAVDTEAATARSPLAGHGGPVAVDNPLSARMAVMRRSLLAGLVEAAAGNQRRGAERVLLGEVGRAFFADDSKVREEERLALALAGTAGPWDVPRSADFAELKGLVDGVLAGLGVAAADWRPTDAGVLEAGCGAEIVHDGRVIGIAGRLADDVAALLEVPAALWVAEVDLAAAVAAPAVAFAPPPRHPAVVSDLTVRHRLDLAYERLAAAIRAAAPAWLESVTPVVRYRGEGVGPDEVKTTVRLTYRHPERSLTQDEVNGAHFAVMETLARQLGVSFS